MGRCFQARGQGNSSTGGSISFEWPRYCEGCEGWKQPLIVDMLRDLGLHRVPVDGCATGLTDKNGTPLFKPWLVVVSSASLVEELKKFRCDKTHEHGKIAGDEPPRWRTTLVRCARPSTVAWMLMNFISKQKTSPLRQRKQVFGTR